MIDPVTHEAFALCDEDEEPSEEAFLGCGACQAQAAAKRKAELERPVILDADGEPYVFVVAARVTRDYGGPEEGGWYYTVYEEMEIRAVHREDVDRVLIAMAGKYPKTGRAYSVLGGNDFAVWIEDESQGRVPLVDGPAGTTHYC
jgi:hypothetical protein